MSAWTKFKNDFDAMSDNDIIDETRRMEDQQAEADDIERLRSWVQPISPKVVAAAFRFDLPGHDDPRALPVIVSAPPPARHHNLFALTWPLEPSEQGFLLSDGTFADREQAAVVAIAKGQTTAEKMTVKGTLFSEDLW